MEHETETGSWDDQGDDIMFDNSGYSSLFSKEDLRRAILEGATIFEVGEEEAILEDGMNIEDIIADGGGYKYEENSDVGPCIRGTDIIHQIDEELLSAIGA